MRSAGDRALRVAAGPARGAPRASAPETELALGSRAGSCCAAVPAFEGWGAAPGRAEFSESEREGPPLAAVSTPQKGPTRLEVCLGRTLPACECGGVEAGSGGGLPNKAQRRWRGRAGLPGGVWDELRRGRGTRVGGPECGGSGLFPLRVSRALVLLTQISGLVSVEMAGLTSPWLPWRLVLEDRSRLYTARDKQGLHPKLPPLPSCHHLLAVTRSSWGQGP